MSQCAPAAVPGPSGNGWGFRPVLTGVSVTVLASVIIGMGVLALQNRALIIEDRADKASVKLRMIAVENKTAGAMMPGAAEAISGLERRLGQRLDRQTIMFDKLERRLNTFIGPPGRIDR